jgi:hypothetical protein
VPKVFNTPHYDLRLARVAKATSVIVFESFRVLRKFLTMLFIQCNAFTLKRVPSLLSPATGEM